MGMDELTISAVLMLITLAGVATVPFIAKLGARFDKKDLFKTVMAVCGILMIATKFIGVDSYPMLIFVCLLYAAANAAYWRLMPSMIYDVCEVEEAALRCETFRRGHFSAGFVQITFDCRRPANAGASAGVSRF